MHLAIALISLLQSEPGDCLKNCEPSEEGLQLIRTYEGFSPFVYKDAAGKDTIGTGHLIKPGEHFKEPLLPPYSEELLQSDAKESGSAVNRLVGVSLHQSQFDALNSFTFNLGGGVLSKSTLLKKVNAKEHNQVPDQIRRWDHVGNNRLKGLSRRRSAEAELYGREGRH